MVYDFSDIYDVAQPRAPIFDYAADSRQAESFIHIWTERPEVIPDDREVVQLGTPVNDRKMVTVELVPILHPGMRFLPWDDGTLCRALKLLVSRFPKGVSVRPENVALGCTLAVAVRADAATADDAVLEIRRPDRCVVGHIHIRSSGSFCTTGRWRQHKIDENGQFWVSHRAYQLTMGDCHGFASGASVRRWVDDVLYAVRHGAKELPPRCVSDPPTVDAGGDGGPIRTEITDDALPGDVARALLNLEFRRNSSPTLQRHSGAFYAWTGDHYRVMSDEDVRAKTYQYLEPHAPKWAAAPKVSQVIDALKARTNVPAHLPIPVWLDDREGPPPSDLIPVKNGLLHVPSRRLMAQTPAFFNESTLAFGFQADAPEPTQWLTFLDSVWPDDPQSVELLQEWMGLLLTTETKYHKILLMIGPPRSGKGTIARIITALLGQENVSGPSLNDLCGTFGLQPLLGKLLAVVSDARLSDRTDTGVMVERLLSISGEDSLSVNRKHLPAWEGQLPTRLMLMSNELPRVKDSSGAFVNRLLILRQTRSFLGNEDHALLDKLMPELPGILQWALIGLDRLTARGRFVQPASGRDLSKQVSDMSSPVAAFIRDECEVGAELVVDKQVLFAAWCGYCTHRGWRSGGTASEFGRNLGAALPLLGASLGELRPRGPKGERLNQYTGIKLNNEQRHAGSAFSGL